MVNTRADDKLTIAALRQALKDVYMQIDEVTREKNRELEAVTAERDNALLRLQQLEADLDSFTPPRCESRNHNGPESSYRGGVHPNA